MSAVQTGMRVQVETAADVLARQSDRLARMNYPKAVDIQAALDISYALAVLRTVQACMADDRMTDCPHCDVTISRASLARHIRQIHPEVTS